MTDWREEVRKNRQRKDLCAHKRLTSKKSRAQKKTQDANPSKAQSRMLTRKKTPTKHRAHHPSPKELAIALARKPLPRRKPFVILDDTIEAVCLSILRYDYESHICSVA